MSPNVAASIKARLLAMAKERGEEFELFLVRFACERFLYRLGASELRDRCILKGAGLLALWMEDPYRTTRDLDFLASGPNDEAEVRAAVSAVCRVPCPEDGLTFDLDSLTVSPIRAQQEYPGHRGLADPQGANVSPSGVDRREARSHGRSRPAQQPDEGLPRHLGFVRGVRPRGSERVLYVGTCA